MLSALLLVLQLPLATPDQDQAAKLISVERIAAVHRQIAAHPHQAGTAGGRAQAELIAQILRTAGLQLEMHSYWSLLSYPRRMTLQLFRGKSKQGILLPLIERSDARDAATSAADLPPGYIAYSATARVRGPIVYVGEGRSEDYANVAVKGAIVLVRHGGVVSIQIAEAAKHGAIGVVLFSEPAASRVWPLGPGRAAWFVERDAFVDRDAEGAAQIPVATIAWSVAEQIFATPAKPTARKTPASPTALPGELDLAVHMNDGPRPIFNVIATIEGSEPGPYVLIGTHHDAWGFGGVDPGQSVAALLELARVLGGMSAQGMSRQGISRQGWKPRHTIRIAFWDAGEFGNLGAAEHSREFAADPPSAYIDAGSGSAPGDAPFPPAPGALHMTAFGAAHSIFDTASYMTRLYDPGFRATRSLAESLGRVLLRLAAADAAVRAATPVEIPDNAPLRGEIDHAEARLAQAKEAYVAGVITRARLDVAQHDLDDARARYERLRTGSGQLTPAIAADEVAKAETRLKDMQRNLEILKTGEDAGMIARRDLDQANQRVAEAAQYLDLARSREQELTHEWELLRKVREFEARGGRFDDSVMEKLSFDYDKQFGRPLPVSALGMTHTHELLNFDHTGRVDIALSPDSPEGRWLIAQLTLRDIPFIVFRGAVPGKATGAHIHLGLPSPRLRK